MTAPTVKPIKDWPSPNRGFYTDFRRWLRDGGYSDSTLKLYSIAARLALGLLDKLYWTINDADLVQVRQYVVEHVASPATQANYRKGLMKLSEYLRHRCRRIPPAKPINWDHYVGSLPGWLTDYVHAYIVHRRRAWLPGQQRRMTIETLCHLTKPLRWMAAHAPLADIGDVAPALWFDYLDFRLAKGIKPATVNRELYDLFEFLRFLADAGHPVCERMLQVKTLPVGDRLPRDIPIDQLCLLLQEIEAGANSSNAGIRRMGVMDRAWVLLMSHSGLRVGEVRRLRLSHLNLNVRRVRIEQSKGLKDRVIPLSQPTVEALRAYLGVRGAAATDHVFISRHRRLCATYCNRRLRTYGRRCGVKVTAHQLRHTAATLLLNAGAPILAVQAILGHKKIETTLIYARLYDGTVATDYGNRADCSAMAQVEGRTGLRNDSSAPGPGQLMAMLDWTPFLRYPQRYQ